MKVRPYSLVCIGLLLFNSVFSQETVELTKKDSITSSSWMFGVGINIVDDSNDVFNELFEFDTQWNVVPILQE
ncbi:MULTISPECIES: hypothetical protein [Cellulophaga]|uniref:hypothetical protein n=1 Tax=Cellulophaga TaxID=104264 RepID=UPI002091C673|nr:MULTISPECIES: hypothetical protein [Cellulophaga]MDO6768121.1 hypothetical protein [Cellulophaga sp. 1_MG-2023]